jgi:non-ribosomal peptide synthetase component F
VRENTLNAFENQAYPFRELLKKVGDEGDFSRNPLFDAMLIVQKRDTSLETFRVGELRFMPCERASHVEAKVDINLDVKEKDGKVFFTLEYCTALFERETMERFVSFFKNAASTAVDNKSIKLADIKISHDLMAASSDIYEKAGLEFEF